MCAAVREFSCVLMSVPVHIKFTAIYMFCYGLMHICMCVIAYVSRFSVSVRGQDIMICTFIRLWRAPFTYPRGAETGIQLACHCKYLAVLHAVSVLLASKGIIHEEQALWLH